MKRILVSGAVLALAVAGIGTAQAQNGLKVTGGGQVFAGDADAQGGGPGDTYGFNAQDLDGDPNTEAAKGNLNIIDRTEGQGGKGVHIRGDVTCIRALPLGDNEDADGVARFGGVLQDGVTYFVVDVTDNGEGNSADDDLIFYREVQPEEDGSPCDGDDETSDMRLARGNAQIHNYEEPQDEGGEGEAGAAALTSLLG